MTKNTRFSPKSVNGQSVWFWKVRANMTHNGHHRVPKFLLAETLRVWVRQHERDTGGGDGGLTTAERQRLKELERENGELRRSNDILRHASAYFAKAEFDRLWKNDATAG